ncbi:peptidase, partial [Yersinia pestis subsp. microtus bv. Talassica]
HFPSNPSSDYFNSTGVTFGSGVDLGQRSKQDLLNDGVPQYIADRLDGKMTCRIKPFKTITGENIVVNNIYRTT